MQATPSSLPAPRHAAPVIAAHWLSVGCIVLGVAAVLLREAVDDKGLRALLLAVHRQAGLTVLVLLALRLLARWSYAGREPGAVADLPPLMRALARFTHGLLYLALFGLPLLGLALSDARGQHPSWFGMLPLPTLVPTDPDRADTLEDWHRLAAWGLGLVVALHAGAALWHHYGRRDNVLRTMLPRRLNLLALGLGLATVVGLGFGSSAAHAVPSFARQTGMDCSGCHIGAFGPQLTPAGMRFKLGGYTDSDGKDGKIPLSAMIVGSYARTRADQKPAPEHLKANDNYTFDEASVFLAGRLSEQFGGFVQTTYSGIDHSTALDQLDLRWARPMKFGDKETTFGVSLNNNPTVQDPFNTLSTWGYPFIDPEAGFGTGEAASLLNGGLSQRVLGASAYALWDSSVYAELGSYRSLSPRMQSNLGVGRDSQRLGGNAYWRLAYLKDLKTQNFSVGVFGWNARLAPERGGATPSDAYRDIGLDASYQFLGTRDHIVAVNAMVLRERARLADTGDTRRLTETRLNASYYFHNTWGVSGGLFGTHGSDPAASTRGQLLQVDWTPWGKEDVSAPAPFAWANVRLGAQLWHYSRFGGESAHASDHDTMHLFVWTSF